MIWSNLKNLGRRHLAPYIIFEICFAIKQALKLLLPKKDKNVKDYKEINPKKKICTILKKSSRIV